jgi:hypothetical protein
MPQSIENNRWTPEEMKIEDWNFITDLLLKDTNRRVYLTGEYTTKTMSGQFLMTKPYVYPGTNEAFTNAMAIFYYGVHEKC